MILFTVLVNEYASELESSLILVDSLKASLKRARMSQKEEFGGDKNSGNNLTNELEAKLKELKDERAELYRQQGIQATHLLSLNDQLRQKDTVLTQQTTEISSLKQAKEQREDELTRMKEYLREKEDGMKIIGDELVALQLELLRLDQWQGKVKENAPMNSADTGNSVDNDSNVSLITRSVTSNLKLTKEKEITAPHQYPISSYTSKPGTGQLLTGSEDQKIILYDLTRISTKLVLKWSKMNGPIVSLAVDEEGGVGASCSAYDREVTIWGLGSGKIQGTLAYSDDSNEVPLLHFGSQARLWMSLGRSVKLWDIQRGLLLRSWNKDMIGNTVQKIVSDAKRPDRLWCFDEKGSFAVLNAVTGKLEVPWTAFVQGAGIVYDCSKERILVARQAGDAESDTRDWIVTGYSRNAGGTGLEGVFEFNLRTDLHVESESVRSLSIHPDRPDLFSLILTKTVLIVKVSSDNWNPETTTIPGDCAGDTVQWGPEEDDPISGERGCKVVVIWREGKLIRLYTLSRI